MFQPFSSDFKTISKGSSFCSFGWVFYKTKTLAKFVDRRKFCCCLFLCQSRIMFELFSSDFKTILKGSSFLGLRSSVFVLESPELGSFKFHCLESLSRCASNTSALMLLGHVVWYRRVNICGWSCLQKIKCSKISVFQRFNLHGPKSIRASYY